MREETHLQSVLVAGFLFHCGSSEDVSSASSLGTAVEGGIWEGRDPCMVEGIAPGISKACRAPCMVEGISPGILEEVGRSVYTAADRKTSFNDLGKPERKMACLFSRYQT